MGLKQILAGARHRFLALGLILDATSAFVRLVAREPALIALAEPMVPGAVPPERLDEAVAAWLLLIDLHPTQNRFRLALAWRYHRLWLADHAMAAFRQVIAQEPGLAAAYQGLASAQRQAGLLTDATHSFRQAIALDPRDAASRCRLAEMAYADGRLNDARRDLADALGLRPADIPALLLRARLHFESGAVSAALADLDNILARDPAQSRAQHYRSLMAPYAGPGTPPPLRTARHRVGVALGAGIGNMIQCTPAIRWLADHLGHPVDVLLNEDFPGCASLFAGAPWVGTVWRAIDAYAGIRFELLIVFDCFGPVLPAFCADRLIASRRDVTFPLPGARHEADYNLFWLSQRLGLTYLPTDIPRYFVGGFDRGIPVANRIGLHAGSKQGIWQAKQWPHFADLARLLARDGFDLVSFGSAAEYVPGTIDATGTSLEVTITAMRACRYLIANDSGLMHVADALGIPLTAIFAPSSVAKNGPLAASSQIVALHKDCAPCQFERDILQTCRCIGEISVERVLSAVTLHMAQVSMPHVPLVVFQAVPDPVLRPGPALVVHCDWSETGAWPEPLAILAWLDAPPDGVGEDTGVILLSPHLTYPPDYPAVCLRHYLLNQRRDVVFGDLRYDPATMRFAYERDPALDETMAALGILGCFSVASLRRAITAGGLRVVSAPFRRIDERGRAWTNMAARAAIILESLVPSEAEHHLGFVAAARRQVLWPAGADPSDAVQTLLSNPRDLAILDAAGFGDLLSAIRRSGAEDRFIRVLQADTDRLIERYHDHIGAMLDCAALVLPPDEMAALVLAAAAAIARNRAPKPMRRLIDAAAKYCSAGVMITLLSVVERSRHAPLLVQRGFARRRIGDCLIGQRSRPFTLAMTCLTERDFMVDAAPESRVRHAIRTGDRDGFIRAANQYLRAEGAAPLGKILRVFSHEIRHFALGDGEIAYRAEDALNDSLTLAVILYDAGKIARHRDALTPPLALAWRSRHQDYAPLNDALARWLRQDGADPVRLSGATPAEIFSACFSRHGLPDADDRGKVSVILCTHNPDPVLLRLAIDSVLAQTYKNLELILVDDGSDQIDTDMIQDLIAIDRRILFLRNPRNAGPYHCRNLALARAEGAFIAFHDADDVAHPQRLAVQIATLSAVSTRQVCYTAHLRFDAVGGVQFEANQAGLSLLGDGPVTSVFRRSALEIIGGFAPVRSRGDIEMRARVRACFGGHAIRHLAAPFMYCSGGAHGLSSATETRHRAAVDLFRRSFSRRIMPPVLDGKLIAPPPALAIPFALRAETGGFAVMADDL